MIFSEHSRQNRVILLKRVAKWRYIKPCAFFSGPLYTMSSGIIPKFGKLQPTKMHCAFWKFLTHFRDHCNASVFTRSPNASQPNFPTGRLLFLSRCMECRRGLAMIFLSVCPSVRPSVKHVHCNKTEEKSVQIFISRERSFSLVFREEWWVEGDPFDLKFWVYRLPLERNRRF